jgi:hypothetical protein
MRFSEITQFIQALRLARLAQQVNRRPVEQLAVKMTRLRGLSGAISPDEAILAARRACRWRSRLAGGLDSCLTRSLVAGALLAHRPGLQLHFGFRPSAEGTATIHDGHAWLTLDGELLADDPPPEGGLESFTELKTISLTR